MVYSPNCDKFGEQIIHWHLEDDDAEAGKQWQPANFGQPAHFLTLWSGPFWEERLAQARRLCQVLGSI